MFLIPTDQMNVKIKKIIDQITSILVSGIDAKQVYLFGSYAQNNATKESDLDIFVVADLTGKKKIEITQQARRLLLKKVLVCSCIFLSIKLLFLLSKIIHQQIIQLNIY